MAVSRKTPTTANHGPTIPGDDFADRVNEEVSALWDRVIHHLDSVAGTNSLTATCTPTLTAYAKNQTWSLVPPNANTGPMVISINGVGNRAIKRADGSAMTGGEFQAGVQQLITDNGTELRQTASVIASINAQESIYAFVLANNTNGGTATSGSRQTYPLNTTILNEITGASLITGGGDINKFNLPAGTFEFEAQAEFWITNRSRLFLHDQTAGALVAGQVGSECDGSSGANVGGNARVVGKFSLAVPSILILQYRVARTQATDGLGRAHSMGEDQHYGYIRIRKVV